VDVVVISHKMKDPIEGEKVGDTLVISPGQRGEHVGVVDIAWDGGQKKVVRITSKIHPLGEDIPDDTGFTKVVEEFNRKINAARDEEYRRKQAQQELDQRTKALVEQALKMTPEEFHEFYQKEMQNMQQMPESQKLQP
jgi:2',3'-cyclic-nucleotide 2'-phosphodiesterase (5'-nucleotidase family)